MARSDHRSDLLPHTEFEVDQNKIMSMSTRDLFDACRRGDIARVRQAVADGLDVRKVVDKSVFNYAPLQYACGYVTCEVIKLCTVCVPIMAHEVS